MTDVIMIAIIVVFFAAAALLVRALDMVVADSGDDKEPADAQPEDARPEDEVTVGRPS